MALTAQTSSVLFGQKEVHTHSTHISISMSSLKLLERTNDAAHDVASAVCVYVCVDLHLEIMLFSFQRHCVFCFPDVSRCCHRNISICIH